MVLLGWIAQSGRPLAGVALLSSFGFGQVLPLLLAGTFAAAIPKLLALRGISRWVPPASGVVLLTSCLLYTSPSPRDGLLSRMPSSA